MRALITAALLCGACRADPEALLRDRHVSCSFEELQSFDVGEVEVGEQVMIRGSYDAQGRLVTSTLDSGNDGRPESHTEYSWMEDHQIESYRVDYGVDGLWDSQATYHYEGGLLQRFEYAHHEELELTSWYRYDGLGHPVEREVDEDGDLEVDSRSAYTTDARGNITRDERDDGLDGDPDEITVYTWNRLDLLVEVFHDYGGDGTWEAMGARSWDRELIREDWMRWVGGDLIWTREYLYDDEDRLVGVYKDMSGDQSWDTVTATTWDCP